MELLRAYSTLPPPPPPPPPGLTRIPDVKRRKTVEGGQGGDSAPFNVFESPEEDWVEGGKKKGREMFQHSADFDLWASALGGASAELVRERLACILGSENCFRLVTVLDSGRAELSPPAFMASWGLREYVMLQAVVKSRLGARLTEVVKAIDAWEEEQVALLDPMPSSVSEPFADETLCDLMSGTIYSQSLEKPHGGSQCLWRAALGTGDQYEFEKVLQDQVARNLPLWASAADVMINHIRHCKTWPLRMYLRMQQQRNWSEATEEKLKLLLQAEQRQVLHWQDYIRKAEPGWVDLVLSLGEV